MPKITIERETLIDLIAEHLRDTYHCTRVWRAWQVGTMGEDDFCPVDESDTPVEIADAVLAALAAQPAEPNMRHPKIQALIGGKARAEIELGLVEQLLEDPNFETTPMDMEHWGPLHDKLKAALTAQPAEPVAWLSGDGNWVRHTDKKLRPDKERFKEPVYSAPAAVPPDERVRVLREALKRHVDHFGDPLQYARAALEATK